MNPLALLLGFGNTLIEKLFPDPTKAAEAKLKLFEMQHNGELAAMTAQTDINKIEAGSSSIFVSGWRPFICWVCGTACAWNWVGLPIGKFALAVLGMTITLSPADLGEMMPLLFGLLGMGGLRTIEKINGVASK